MEPSTYVHKTREGYEYGYIRHEWRPTGHLPHSRVTEYALVSSDYVAVGVAPDYAQARAAARELPVLHRPVGGNTTVG